MTDTLEDKETSPFTPTIDAFTRHLRALGRSRHTIRLYTGTARLLEQFCVTHRLTSDPTAVSRDHCEMFMDDQIQRHGETSTPQTRHKALRAFFDWLADREEIPSPMAKIGQPKAPEHLIPVLGDDEVNRILDAAGKGKGFYARRDAALIWVLLSTGARASEVTNLTVADLDLDLSVCRIVKGKGGKSRNVPLNAGAIDALDRYLASRRRHVDSTEPWLWLGRSKRSHLGNTGVWQIVRRVGAGAGLPKLHPHQFRHTFADRWLAAGLGEQALMAIMGWNTPTMLARYAKANAASRAMTIALASHPMDAITNNGRRSSP